MDSTGNSNAPQQGVEFHVSTLAGHQPYPLDAKHPGNRLELRAQGLELHIHQVRAVQVDGIAMFAANLALGHVDPVLHQQVEDVPQDADAVLAMHFDTHVKARFVVGGLIGLRLFVTGRR